MRLCVAVYHHCITPGRNPFNISRKAGLSGDEFPQVLLT